MVELVLLQLLLELLFPVMLSQLLLLQLCGELLLVPLPLLVQLGKVPVGQLSRGLLVPVPLLGLLVRWPGKRQAGLQLVRLRVAASSRQRSGSAQRSVGR